MNYEFYIADSETTGLDPVENDVIETSLIRLSTQEQKTWLLKPININNISTNALRVNGHKLEDILHQTKEGRENYLDPNKIIVDIENWVMDDGVPAQNRFLIGQNIGFDRSMFENLWKKCNASGSFPFGRRMIDTMGIELFFDYCIGKFAEGYSLSNLTKKYGVKNEKAHSAAADTKATKDVFLAQVNFLKKLIKSES